MEPPCGATVLPFYARAAGFAVPPARPAIRRLDCNPLRGRLVGDSPSDFKKHGEASLPGSERRTICRSAAEAPSGVLPDKPVSGARAMPFAMPSCTRLS